MAKKVSGFADLSKQIERMGNRSGMPALLRAGAPALNATRSEYDRKAGSTYTRSGKGFFNATISVKRKSNTTCVYSFNTSVKGRALWEFEVSPSVRSDTTGSNRTRIQVAVKKGQWITVPNGFIWRGMIFRRTSEAGSGHKYITRADRYVASASTVLNENWPELMAYLEREAARALTDELKRGKK